LLEKKKERAQSKNPSGLPHGKLKQKGASTGIRTRCWIGRTTTKQHKTKKIKNMMTCNKRNLKLPPPPEFLFLECGAFFVRMRRLSIRSNAY